MQPFFKGNTFAPKDTHWPMDHLRKKRRDQNEKDSESREEAVKGLTYQEDSIPMVL